jgi:hypothetical protein
VIKNISKYFAVLTLAVCAASAQASLLDDGSFDLATTGTQTSNSAWVLTANFPDPVTPTDASVQFQDAPWASNDPGPPEHGVWLRSFTGKPGGPLAQADLVQSVVVAGGDFSLSFDARRELNFLARGWSVDLSSSGTGGSDSIDLLATAPNDGSWNTYNLALSGVSAGDTLTVRATMVDGMDALANPQSAMWDNFVLVPEPTALVGAGIGLLGLLILRRRR